MSLASGGISRLDTEIGDRLNFRDFAGTDNTSWTRVTSESDIDDTCLRLPSFFLDLLLRSDEHRGRTVNDTRRVARCYDTVVATECER